MGLIDHSHTGAHVKIFSQRLGDRFRRVCTAFAQSACELLRKGGIQRIRQIPCIGISEDRLGRIHSVLNGIHCAGHGFQRRISHTVVCSDGISIQRILRMNIHGSSAQLRFAGIDLRLAGRFDDIHRCCKGRFIGRRRFRRAVQAVRHIRIHRQNAAGLQYGSLLTVILLIDLHGSGGIIIDQCHRGIADIGRRASLIINNGRRGGRKIRGSIRLHRQILSGLYRTVYGDICLILHLCIRHGRRRYDGNIAFRLRKLHAHIGLHGALRRHVHIAAGPDLCIFAHSNRSTAVQQSRICTELQSGSIAKYRADVYLNDAFRVCSCNIPRSDRIGTAAEGCRGFCGKLHITTRCQRTIHCHGRSRFSCPAAFHGGTGREDDISIGSGFRFQSIPAERFSSTDIHSRRKNTIRQLRRAAGHQGTPGLYGYGIPAIQTDVTQGTHRPCNGNGPGWIDCNRSRISHHIADPVVFHKSIHQSIHFARCGRHDGQRPCVDDTCVGYSHTVAAQEKEVAPDLILPDRIDRTGHIDTAVHQIDQSPCFVRSCSRFEIHIGDVASRNIELLKAVDCDLIIIN